MSAAGGTWGSKPSVGRWVRSRPVVRCWLCQQSARTLVLPQWPHCSQPPGSLEEVPRPPPPNRGQINPLEDRPGEGLQGATLPSPPFWASGLWEVTFHPRVPSDRTTADTGVSPREGGAPRPSPTPTVVQVPGARKCQWGGRRRPDIFGPVGLIPATTACPTGS